MQRQIALAIGAVALLGAVANFAVATELIRRAPVKIEANDSALASQGYHTDLAPAPISGCCERQPGCCDNIWADYCATRHQWCLDGHCGLFGLRCGGCGKGGCTKGGCDKGSCGHHQKAGRRHHQKGGCGKSCGAKQKTAFHAPPFMVPACGKTASAQKGKSCGLAKVRLPKVHMPKVHMPKVCLPEVHLPKVKMPKMKAPKIACPKFDFAKFDLGKGKAHLPHLTLPEWKMPKLPKCHLTGGKHRGKRHRWCGDACAYSFGLVGPGPASHASFGPPVYSQPILKAPYDKDAGYGYRLQSSPEGSFAIPFIEETPSDSPAGEPIEADRVHSNRRNPSDLAPLDPTAALDAPSNRG